MADTPPPPLSPEEARMQRLLKIIVAGLGVLILIVLGVMVVTILNRTGNKQDAPSPEVVTEQDNRRALPAAAPFDYGVPIPSRAMVIETRVDGDTLVLRLALADGAEEIWVLDMTTGGLRGKIRLKAGEGMEE